MFESQRKSVTSWGISTNTDHPWWGVYFFFYGFKWRRCLPMCIVVLSKTHSYTHKCSHVPGTADWSIGSPCWFHFLGQFKTHCSQMLSSQGLQILLATNSLEEKKKHWCHQCGLTELHTHTLESWSLCADNYKSTKETLWDRNEIEPLCFTPVWQRSGLAWFYRNNNVASVND